MRPEISPPSPQLFTFITTSIFLFTIFPGTTQCRHQDCQSSFECGKLKEISYPFWGNKQSQYCGRQGFELQCKPNHYPVINMEENQSFIVLEIEQNSQWMRVARSDIWHGACPHLNTQLNQSPFSFNATGIYNLSIFRGCQTGILFPFFPFFCNTRNSSRDYKYFSLASILDPGDVCDSYITVPVFITAYDQYIHGTMSAEEVLKQGFIADYHYEEEDLCKSCRNKRGRCEPKAKNSTNIVCINALHGSRVQQDRVVGYTHLKGTKYIGYGFVVFLSGAIFACLIIFGYRTTLLLFRMIKSKMMKDPNVETYIKKYGSLAPKRYKCADIKKITNSFREKLGEGGFCSVYKGKLEDGRLVAIKVLKTNTSKGNGEDFINEVISICRTSHVNIVSLLGYCYNADKKALLFEFMPNGSLEKFINNENISTSGRLEWDKLHEIAIGIARGLEYLHRGCNTRILHLDIKPHNVLLDENFCPKISDFGLAKLCPKESVISMSNARGTVGYIAPELFSRNFGRVSHKADVYSFGMMVLEMVGGRKNIDETADDSSEIYYPHWVYDRLQEENSLGLHGVMTSQDNEIAKKMIIIGLWCIQTYPVHRPSMNEVLFMLEGSLDSLKIPPKPFIYSPSRTPVYDEANK